MVTHESLLSHEIQIVGGIPMDTHVMHTIHGMTSSTNRYPSSFDTTTYHTRLPLVAYLVHGAHLNTAPSHMGGM